MLFYFIYFLFTPILFSSVYIAQFFNKKISQHIKDENKTIHNVLEKLSTIDRNKTKVLLFHAASAGEFEQLKPILKKIDRTKYFLIQTFTSPTIYKKESDSKLFDVCCYHPYDIFWKSYYFFSQNKPSAYIITRHDIWPAHLFISRKLEIPIFYINANIHLNSIWVQKYFYLISKAVFNNLNFCLVPSKNIKILFSKIMNPNKIYIMGDSRFDQIIERKKSNQNKSILPDYLNKTFNIIFGSYDKYDEPLIIESLIAYYPNGTESLKKLAHKIILVPHEINDKMHEVFNTLKNNNFDPILFSNLDFDTEQSNNLIIIDRTGILADIYKYTQLAYIGSGFSDGVHSVIEPGVYANVVSFGPNIELLDEAKYLYNNNLGHMIKNKRDMLNFFDLHKNNNQMKNSGQAIMNYITSQKNASQKIIQFIGEQI